MTVAVISGTTGKVPADETEWQSIGIDNWDRQKAQNEMENRINSFYEPTPNTARRRSPRWWRQGKRSRPG